jgi:uncharacterized protein
VTPLEVLLGIVSGFVAGVLSGAFGVGGGIITTPAIQVLLGGTPIQALATPLPVIFPTALVGANNYRRAGQLSSRAAAWAVGPGVLGAVGGALLTDVVPVHSLLLITACLLIWMAVRVIRGTETKVRPRGSTPGWEYAVAGLVGGFVSGLLGIGGGIVVVPILTAMLGMPLKRALGTSLVIMTALVIPGTIVHTWLGHIDWAIAAVLVIGVIPGAWLGSKLALAAKDRTLRIAVGSFLCAIGAAYGIVEFSRLIGWPG